MDTPMRDAHDGVPTQPWQSDTIDALTQVQMRLHVLEEVLHDRCSWPPEDHEANVRSARANVYLATEHVRKAIEYLMAL